MRPFGRNAQQLLVALQSYDAEIDELIQAIPQHEVPISSDQGRRLVDAATKLKADVKHDYETSQKYDRDGKFSPVEPAFWAMFPHKLFVALQKLKLNTRPGHGWLRALHDAQHEVRYAVSGIQEWIEAGKD